MLTHLQDLGLIHALVCIETDKHIVGFGLLKGSDMYNIKYCSIFFQRHVCWRTEMFKRSFSA